MKLRTEMLKIGGEWRLATFVGLDDKRDPATAKEHDAMAAHALLQAMGEICDSSSGWPDQHAEDVASKIEQRAAEILAGWLGEDRG